MASDSKYMLRNSLHQWTGDLLCAAVHLMLDLCPDCQVVHCAMPGKRMCTLCIFQFESALPEHDWSGLSNPWSKASNCVRTRPFHTRPTSLKDQNSCWNLDRIFQFSHLIPDTGVDTTLGCRVNEHRCLPLQALTQAQTLHCRQLHGKVNLRQLGLGRNLDETPIVRPLVPQPDRKYLSRGASVKPHSLASDNRR